MEYGTPQYRDSVRDVLAMLEAALQIQGGLPDSGMARENLAVLLEHADAQDCLQVAMSMLATAWQLVCHVRAEARGTSAEQEIADIFTRFRDLLQ